MDPALNERLTKLEERIEATYQSAEKTRKYLLWTLIASIIVFILPLLGLVFALPSFMSTYQGLIDM